MINNQIKVLHTLKKGMRVTRKTAIENGRCENLSKWKGRSNAS